MLDKQLIKKLIAEYQEMVAEVRLCPRDIQVDRSHSNVFVGLRRAGKSYLMFQCIASLIDEGVSPKSILYFNFEDDRLGDMDLSDLDRIKVCYEEMYPGKPVFFLDELQVVAGWEKFARRLADTGYRAYITGSNAKMLSTEVASTLGGRYAVTEVYPYSFREFIRAKGLELKDSWRYLPSGELQRAFDEYFRLGGLPEVTATSAQFKRSWLSGLFDRIYFGDLIARNNIRKNGSLKALIRKLVDSVGQPLSVNRAASIVTASGMPLKPETAADYLGYMEQAWVTFSLENFAGKLSERISYKKYYFVDNGFITLFDDEAGDALLENLAAVCLRKKHSGELYYYRRNIEVDFYVPSEGLAVQACYSFSDPQTRKRELSALQALHEYQPLSKAVVLTRDGEEEELSLDSGLKVQVLPIWKWILFG